MGFENIPSISDGQKSRQYHPNFLNRPSCSLPVDVNVNKTTMQIQGIEGYYSRVARSDLPLVSPWSFRLEGESLMQCLGTAR